MAINPNEDTEFNEALRKHGILPPLEPAPRTPSPPPSPTLEDALDDLTVDELRELGEGADDETERVVEKYRRQRLAEMRKIERRARFGRMYPIGRDDYTREVTEASQVDEEGDENGKLGKGTGVVCFLYKDGLPRSDRTKAHLETLATRHPRTKFVSIVGDKCIPNLPDARIPMLIVYRKGDIINQLVAWGGDRERNVEELEAVLVLCGAIIPEEKRGLRKSRDKDVSDEDDDDEEEQPSRSRAAMINGRAPKNVRRSAKDDDSDSDFDL